MSHRSFIAALLFLSLFAFDRPSASAQARGREAPRRMAPPAGRAVPRVGPPPRAARSVSRVYRYRPYVYRPGLRLNFYSSYGYPFAYPYGYSSYGYGFGYGYPYAYGAGSYRAAYRHAYGGVQIKDADPNAEVLVDGYYAGVVDDFDGVFQQLNLTRGAHRIEIRTPNGPSLTFDVNIIPGQTITYRARP
jgi:hypothetical protein